MDLRTIKDKAAEAFSKGKFQKSAELYGEYLAREKKDHQARLRMGDAWVKSGKKAKAIEAYSGAAEGFAKDGFLPRAIAASKLILELDPSHQGVQQMLAGLYAQRGTGGPSPSHRPKSPGASESTAGNQAVQAALQIPVGTTPASAAPLPTFPGEGGLRPGDPSDLPPELSVEYAQPEPASQPEVFEIELDAEPPVAPSPKIGELPQDDEGIEVDLEVSPSAAADPPSLPPAPTASAEDSAPPGLRRRGPWSPRTPFVFDELSLEDAPHGPNASLPVATEGETLLHAVERAAETGRRARGESPTDLVEESLQAPSELTARSREAGELPKIPLFSELDANAFIELFERCPLRRLQGGERVFAQGSRGESFFVVCEGKVRIFREEPEGRRELATLGEGAFFGEMALLSGAPRSATVEASVDDTQILEISASLLANLSRRYPQVSTALKNFCRQRLLSNVMNGAALFAPFSRSERRVLVERFRARDIQAGTVIIQQGQSSDGLYVLLAGEVAVEVGGTEVARLREGELFGEMSLLRRTPATGTVRATQRTSLLRLPRPDFDELISSHPQVLMLVSELSEERQRKNEGALANQATGADGAGEDFADLLLV